MPLKKIFLYSAPILVALGCFVVAERDTPIVRQFDQYILCLTKELRTPGSALSARAEHPARLRQLYRVTMLFWGSWDVRFDEPGHIFSTIPNGGRPYYYFQ